MAAGWGRRRAWTLGVSVAIALCIVLMWHRGITAPLWQAAFWVLMTGVPEQAATPGTVPRAVPGQGHGAWLLPGEFAVARYPLRADSLDEPLQVVAVAPEGVDMRDALSSPYDIDARSLRPGSLDGVQGVHADVAFLEASMVSFWHRDAFEVGQTRGDTAPVMWAAEVGEDHERIFTDLSIYRLQRNGTAECLWSSYHEGWLFLNTPDVRLVPRLSGDPPSVVAFQPPFGLGCWRWDGVEDRPVVPRGPEWRMLWATITNGLLYSTLSTAFVLMLVLALSVRAILRLARKRRGSH